MTNFVWRTMMKMSFGNRFEKKLHPLSGLFALALGLLMFSAQMQSAIAKGALPPVLANWYEGLKNSNRPQLAAILTEDAIIDMRDLGVTQTKQEFLDSLDEWAEASRDAKVLTRIGDQSGDQISVDVCYRFSDNEVQTKEDFTLAGGKIKKSAQQAVGEKCEGF